MQGTVLSDTHRSFTAHIRKVFGLTLEFRSSVVSKTTLYEMTLLLAGSAHCHSMATHTPIFYTRMMKLGIGEGRSAQGMSDPPSQLIGQEYQDVMG